MADSTQTLICPACGKEMQKIFVERTNCYIDICTEGCGGIFFDNREYKKFDENHESIDEIKKALEGKTFKPVDNTIKRVCPVCGMRMMKNSTSIKGQIIIDECYKCGGKFLDCNELDKIRDEYKTEAERSQDIVNYLKSNMGSEFEAMHAHQQMQQSQQNEGGIFKSMIKKFF